jgi:hypothetical protein
VNKCTRLIGLVAPGFAVTHVENSGDEPIFVITNGSDGPLRASRIRRHRPPARWRYLPRTVLVTVPAASAGAATRLQRTFAYPDTDTPTNS